MDWERLAAIAKSRNLHGKDALRFFEERQFQLQREREIEHERTIALLKKQIDEAERKLRHRKKEETSCANLQLLQSVEIGEHEAEVRELQEIQATQEIVSVESEECGAVTASSEELKSGFDDEGVGAQELLSVKGEENAQSVQDHREGIAGCCKLSFDGFCSDACPTLKDLKPSQDWCDESAKLEGQRSVTVAGDDTSKDKRRLAHNKDTLAELKVVQKVDGVCIAGCCKHVLGGVYIAGCCKPSFNGVCSDACPTVKDVTASHDPGDSCAVLESEHVGDVNNERETKIILSGNGSEEVLVEKKVDVNAANGGPCARARRRTRVRKNRKVRERGMANGRRSSRRRAKVGCKRRLKKRKLKGVGVSERRFMSARMRKRRGPDNRSRVRAMLKRRTRKMVQRRRPKLKAKNKRVRKFGNSNKRRRRSERWKERARRRTRELRELLNRQRTRIKAFRFFLWPLKKRKWV